jgi:hypothetical protein
MQSISSIILKFQINTFDEFLRKVFFANILIVAIDLLLYIFFDDPINCYYLREDRFADYFKAIDSLQIVNTWEGFNFYEFNLTKNNIHHVVPPLTIFFWAVSGYIIKLNISKYTLFVLFYICPFVFLYLLRHKFKNKSKYLYLLIFSYPILISIQRGNVATLVFFFLFLSLLYRDKKLLGSILLLVISISFKITPVIFLINFYRRKISLFLKLILIVALSLVGLNFCVIFFNTLIVNTQIYNSLDFFHYLKAYNESAIENLGGLRFGSSLYMPIITIAKVLNESFFQQLISINSYGFNLFIICFIVLFSFLKNGSSGLIKLFLNNNSRLELSCISFILFMPVTADYYLLVLFIPILLIPFNVLSTLQKFCYLCLLIPKEVINTNIIIGKDLPIGAFLNPMFLILILLHSLNLLNFSKRKEYN